MEGPDPEMQEDGNRKESSWEFIRDWFRVQKNFGVAGNNFPNGTSLYGGNAMPTKSGDSSLLLGVLGCPLAPIPLVTEPLHPLHIKDNPNIVSSSSLLFSCYIFIHR